MGSSVGPVCCRISRNPFLNFRGSGAFSGALGGLKEKYPRLECIQTSHVDEDHIPTLDSLDFCVEISLDAAAYRMSCCQLSESTSLASRMLLS